MRKIISAIVMILFVLLGAMGAYASDADFNENEYNNAVTVTENAWSEFQFNSDLFFRVMMIF